MIKLFGFSGIKLKIFEFLVFYREFELIKWGILGILVRINNLLVLFFLFYCEKSFLIEEFVSLNKFEEFYFMMSF